MSYWRLIVRQVKHSRVDPVNRHLKLLWVLLPGALLDSYSEYWRKILHASGKGKGRGTILKYLSILFLTRSTLRENYLTRASHAGTLSDPNWLQLAVAFPHRRKKVPNSSSLQPSCPPKERECWEVPVKFTVQRHSLTKRLSPNLRTIKRSPCPAIHHITKGLFTAVPLANSFWLSRRKCF